MLEFLACCVDLLVQTIFEKPGNGWKVLASLPVVFVVGYLFPYLLYFILFQVVAIAFVIYLRPPWILLFMHWKNLKINGFKEKYQKVGDFTFCYAERGKASETKLSLLFLHGFSATKDMWFPMVTGIPSDRHILLLDMPGHGNSTQKIDYSYSLTNQASRVAQFVIATGLGKRPFHLIGISMGGGVSVVYAARHPKDVAKLSLMCPAGISEFEISDYMQDVKKGLIFTSDGMMPLDYNEVKKIFPYLFHMPGIRLPKLYSWMFCEVTKPMRTINAKVSNDLQVDFKSQVLNSPIHVLAGPTQVIWGKYDRLVHPSGADIIKAALPDCSVHMLDRCGHTISYDRPFKAMKLILEFGKQTN